MSAQSFINCVGVNTIADCTQAVSLVTSQSRILKANRETLVDFAMHDQLCWGPMGLY